MKKLTTKKGLFELFENGYSMKITENTFEKMKYFFECVKNDYIDEYEKNKEKYITLIKDFNVIYDIEKLEKDNWSDIAISRIIRQYFRICENFLNNIDKFSKIDKIKVKSKELYFINRKSYIQKKDIYIDKENQLIKSKYSFLEYEVIKLNK